MVADIHWVFVHEVGVLWGEEGLIGGTTGRRGVIVGLSGFIIWLEGSGRFFAGMRGSSLFSTPREVSWTQISMKYLSVSLGSFRERDT